MPRQDNLTDADFLFSIPFSHFKPMCDEFSFNAFNAFDIRSGPVATASRSASLGELKQSAAKTRTSRRFGSAQSFRLVIVVRNLSQLKRVKLETFESYYAVGETLVP